MKKQKTKQLTIRIPEYLDKQIHEMAQLYFNNDYSKAVRFLCQLALIMSERLDGDFIRSFLERLT